MITHARPAARFAVSAAAALALGTGLAAVGAATSADAAERPTRATHAALGAGQVDSHLVVSGTDLSVISAVGPSSDYSYVESTMKGKLTLGCFADGAVVAGTTVYAGWVRTGSLDGAPWNNSGYYVDAVAEPAAAAVSAPVVLKNVLRDRSGDLADLDCAAGSTPGFYRYQITYLSSARHAFDGTVTGTDRSWPNTSYYFAAPLV
jgi:hypothetical protein